MSSQRQPACMHVSLKGCSPRPLDRFMPKNDAGTMQAVRANEATVTPRFMRIILLRVAERCMLHTSLKTSRFSLISCKSLKRSHAGLVCQGQHFVHDLGSKCGGAPLQKVNIQGLRHGLMLLYSMQPQVKNEIVVPDCVLKNTMLPQWHLSIIIRWSWSCSRSLALPCLAVEASCRVLSKT